MPLLGNHLQSLCAPERPSLWTPKKGTKMTHAKPLLGYLGPESSYTEQVSRMMASNSDLDSQADVLHTRLPFKSSIPTDTGSSLNFLYKVRKPRTLLKYCPLNGFASRRLPSGTIGLGRHRCCSFRKFHSWLCPRDSRLLRLRPLSRHRGD